jgi:TonB family protein
MQKRLAVLSYFVLTFIVTAHLSASAQSNDREGRSVESCGQDKTRQGPCSGGIVDRLVVYKPEPIYPPKTKGGRATGRVFVQVQVDEEGKVVSARACSGPVALHQAATNAACKARFSPTLLAGKPRKFSGILTYNFIRRKTNR